MQSPETPEQPEVPWMKNLAACTNQMKEQGYKEDYRVNVNSDYVNNGGGSSTQFLIAIRNAAQSWTDVPSSPPPPAGEATSSTGDARVDADGPFDTLTATGTKDKGMSNLITLTDPRSPAAEAYQSLRTNLEFWEKYPIQVRRYFVP